MNSSPIVNGRNLPPDNFKEVKSQMTLSATDLIAGVIISDKKFPAEATLPNFIPLQFNNFGHFYLFDHERFLTIIFETIAGYKKIGERYKTPIWPLLLSLAVPIILIIILVNTGQEENGLYFLSILSGGIVYAAVKPNKQKKMDADIASYKADVIFKLLTSEWKKNGEVEYSDRFNDYLSSSGKANCDDNNCPILIMFDDDIPFPGYGNLLLDKQFICDPKKIELAKQKKDADLFETLTSKLKQGLEESGLTDIGFGKVIVVNHESISIDSPWLDDNKVPYLFKQIEEVEALSNNDYSGSTRIYFLVEVLFPKYDSAACFFIRSYKAGNAAGFHIAITTVGPPLFGQRYLNDRIMQFNIEKREKDTIVGGKLSLNNESNYEYKQLSRIESQIKTKEKFHQTITNDQLKKTDPIEEDKDFDEKEIEKKLTFILDNETLWPGRYYRIKKNVREINSRKLGGDFFGYPELIGSVTSAYSQIVEKILNIVEGEGFDVSSYRDKEGKLTINADRIEKVIVGEVVNMKANEDKKSDNTSKTETIAKADK